MDSSQTFESFLSAQTPHVDLVAFTANLALTTAMVFILAYAYTRYGSALSNRRAFSRNLVVVGMTTMVIITIVKSSLALSLGLVGALSIVRFRTPIKEPEELAYLFLSIAIGLGLGAGQRLVVAIGFVFIIVVIWFFHLRRSAVDEQGMHLSVVTDSPEPDLLERITEVLESNAAVVRLRRLDESADSFQCDFSVSFDRHPELTETKRQLQSVSDRLQISFLDNQLT